MGIQHKLYWQASLVPRPLPDFISQLNNVLIPNSWGVYISLRRVLNMLFAIISYVEMSHLAQTIHNCLYVNDLELHTWSCMSGWLVWGD